MENRADKLTKPAPGALFGTDRENFTHGSIDSLLSQRMSQQVGWFFFQAKPLERFWFRNAILIKALVFIEFINHLLEFFPIDDPADDIGRTPSGGLIKVAVIEHIALFEVLSLSTLRGG